MAGLGLDILTRVVNVHWKEKGKHFLYSGADGMFGSEDGHTWKKAKASVPAKSLAWADDIWIAAGESECWRSENGAETWQSMNAPIFEQVAAMTLEASTEGDGKGIFAGWLTDEDGTNQVVYTSHDRGKSWSLTHTIPMTVGEDGYENVTGFGGCGGAIFIGTTRGTTSTHGGDAMFHVSTDGISFSSQMAFGPGIDVGNNPLLFPRAGFSAGGMAFDGKTKTYIATGQKDFTPVFGTRQSFMLYAKSASPHFAGGEGTIAASASVSGAGGDSIGVVSSAAGGDGGFAGGYLHIKRPFAAELSGNTKALFIPGTADTLESLGSSPTGFLGSFCFNDFASDDTTTDNSAPAVPGMFACVSFGNDGSGGVYVARYGSTFTKTHSGSGIPSTVGRAASGAVAVGNLSFLESSSDIT